MAPAANLVRYADNTTSVVIEAKQAEDAAALSIKNGPYSYATRIIDDTNIGAVSKINVDGRFAQIGDVPNIATEIKTTGIEGPAVRTLDGDWVPIRIPRTYDKVVQNADGTKTYFKGGDSLTYDADGFPLFRSKGDVYLDVDQLLSGVGQDHFKAANKIMGDALRADPNLADQLGLLDSAVAHFLKETPPRSAPELYTWHHHQDTGRMQLVLRSEHRLLPGGHIGGMKIWGGGRN